MQCKEIGIKLLLYLEDFVFQKLDFQDAEAIVRRCFLKKVFLRISQNLQENTCLESPFKNVAEAWNFIKKRLQHRYFPVNIAKFLRTAFL